MTTTFVGSMAIPLKGAAIAALVLSTTAPGGPVFRGLGVAEGFHDSVASDVSADGSVVVGGGGTPTASQPVIWAPTETRLLGGGPYGGSARAVSANGSVVVGWRNGAFRRTPGEGVVDLAGGWTANGVSDDGTVVVGESYLTHPLQAFRWTESDGMQPIGTLPGGRGSNAQSISGDGYTIVGASGDADGRRQAFRWTQDEGMVGLGHLPAANPVESWAFDASADGSTIVGYSRSDDRIEAFRWTPATGMRGLGDLPGGEFNSLATAISADGTIIVGSAVPGDSPWGAFIWDPANGMRDLREVLATEHGADVDGWTLMSATGISADGSVVVGYGLNPSGNREAWIATIPEPTSGVMVLAAMVWLVGTSCASGRRSSICSPVD